MDRILKGLAKFQTEVFPKQKQLFEKLASSQSPRALFITCSDSRLIPQLLIQCEPGEIFICRNAGNMVPPHGEVAGGVSATIEYAVCALKVKHIIICGHSDCGAMKGILHPEILNGMPTVEKWLGYGDAARWVVRELYPGLSEQELMPHLIEQNVVAQMANLRTHASVASRMATGALEIHGWVYHIHTGKVDAYDPAERRFVNVFESSEAKRLHRAEVA